MLRITLCFLAITSFFLVSANAAQLPRSLLPTMKQINSLRADASQTGLESACDAGLRLQSHPIADFSPSPHYGANGPTVESKDAPVSTLRRESLAVYRLALCSQVFRDARYSAKAEEILDGWARTTKQIGTLQGADGFNFYFPDALLGAYLLRQQAGWSDNAFGDFVRKVVVPANTAARPNNHGNWGVLLMVTAGGYLNDSFLIEQGRQRWLELMRTQVAADGSLPLETCRSDTSNWCSGPTKGIKGIAYTHYTGIAYTHYTLYPTVIAAEVLRNLGKDVYSTPESALLCKAYRRAVAWSLHPETFPYYASNHGKLDGIHNIDYFFILQRRCPMADGSAVFEKFGSSAADPLYIRALYFDDSH